MKYIKTLEEFKNQKIYDDYSVLDKSLEEIDLSNVTKKSAKKQFVNFEIICLPSSFGDILFNDINEDKNVSYDIKKVCNEICRKYSLEDWQFQIINGCNDISVALVIPKTARNEELITKDMIRFGYYESIKYIQNMFGYPYLKIKFDPRFPKSINNTVRSMSCILHLTPMYNLDSIKQNGFIPQHKNEIFNYPPRLHFLKGDISKDNIIFIGQQLCKANTNVNNNGDYVLFTLDVNKIPKDVNFIGDSCYEYGVCTEDNIPYDCVISKEFLKFDK